MLLAAPSFVVLTSPDASLGAATATEALAALKVRGIGHLVLDSEVANARQFDEVVQIGADGSWTRTGAKPATNS